MRFSFMRLLLCILLLTSGCGYHLRGTAPVPSGDNSSGNSHSGYHSALRSLTFSSGDPYGPTARAVREQLLLGNITIAPDDTRTDIPSLRLLGENSSQLTASIFRDGKTAEYQMVMTINAQVLFPGRDIYPLQARVYRSFFDNPLTALAKDSEEELLKQEMRTQAAQQLIRQMLMLDPMRKPKSSQQTEPGPTKAG